MEQAQKIGKIDEERLLRLKKLVLLVDLDQTLIHTTNDNVPKNLKDVFHFQLWGHGSVWYHTRLRPRTREFLESIEKLYELHICTFGTRSYAHVIAKYLDPNGRYFSDRILSRDECFSQNSKTANLKELFPRGDHMVCIIDDREDVWNYAPNLIHVRPYHFFRHTGDINAPPGLTKQDEDDKTGFTFNKDGSLDKGDTEEEGKVEAKTGSSEEKKAEEKSEAVEAAALAALALSKSIKVRRVTSDLSLSDEEGSSSNGSSSSSRSSGGDAAVEGDKEEESGDDKKKNKEAVGGAAAEQVESSAAVAVVDGAEAQEAPPKDPVAGDPLAPAQASEGTTAELVAPPTAESTNEGVVATATDPTLPIPPAVVPHTDSEIEVEDPDDYLLYLEHILRSIHEAFYSLKSEMDTANVPDVKTVVPYVRRKVLKNISIVFSGVVPTEVPLDQRKNTKPYSVAMSLGAHISERIIPPNKPCGSNEVPTTHVVAARLGTAKVNEARRYKGIQIVTPDWLWCCAERWERVDERLFLLGSKNKTISRVPPGHHHHQRRSDGTKNGQFAATTAAVRKERTPSGRFMDTINPLLSFSMDEIDAMGHEVDDIINESDSSSSSSEDGGGGGVFNRIEGSKSPGKVGDEVDQSVSELTKGSESSSSSSSSSSSYGSEEDSSSSRLKLHIKKRKKNKEDTETEDEPVSVKFRRGEAVPSEVENLMLTSEDDDTATNDQDDGEEEEEWMARALEKEFMQQDNNNSSQDE